MALNYKVWTFPDFQIKSQLFHVPGFVADGGLTSGGARIYSPEPGGRSMLEIQPAFRVKEWETPLSSWLMSKTNGAIFRVRLTKTPQIAGYSQNAGGGGEPWDNSQNWDNSAPWLDDGVSILATGSSLEGSTTIITNVSTFGEFLRHGHVIGHGDNCYLIDDISYGGAYGASVTITVTPPLRKNITAGDLLFMQPYFLGTITNGTAMRASYDASNVGGISLNKIVFQEVIL